MKKSKANMNRKKANIAARRTKDEIAREPRISYEVASNHTKDISSNKISPETRERIRSQIMKGKSKREIAKELGKSHDLVRYDTKDKDTVAPIDYKGRKYHGYTKQQPRFASMSRLESGKRYLLLRLPIKPGDKRTDVLSQLLNYAVKRYKIKRIFVDKFFFTVESLQLLQRLNINYVIIPYLRTPRMQQLLEIMPPPPLLIKNYLLKNTTFNLLIAKRKDKNGRIVKKLFATNEKIDDINSINQLVSRRSFDFEITVNSKLLKSKGD